MQRGLNEFMSQPLASCDANNTLGADLLHSPLNFSSIQHKHTRGASGAAESTQEVDAAIMPPTQCWIHFGFSKPTILIMSTRVLPLLSMNWLVKPMERKSKASDRTLEMDYSGMQILHSFSDN